MVTEIAYRMVAPPLIDQFEEQDIDDLPLIKWDRDV